MRILIITLFLLASFGCQSQTKWRQIERASAKWRIAAAYDSIPGQIGYAGKWINFAAYLDSINIDLVQTIDTFEVYDTNKLRISLSQDAQPAKVVTLPSGGGSGIDSTIVSAGWGIDVTESPSNTFTVKADTAEVATQYDLTLKQDKLVSGTNIKTVNSNSLLGSGNLTVGSVTSIGTSAPLTGGTITSSGTIGLSYDPIYLGLDGSNRLVPAYNTATWNANQLRGKTIAVPFNPTTGQVLTYDGSNWTAATPSSSATNLTYSGATSPVTLNSSTGTDVTLTSGSNIDFVATSSNITISGASTNLTVSGLGPNYNLNSSTGTDITVAAGTGISLSTTSSSNLTISALDNSSTNEAQTITLGGTYNGSVSLTSVQGVGGGSFSIPSAQNAILWRTSNLSTQTFDAVSRQLTFSSASGQGLTATASNSSITILETGKYRIEYNGSYQTASPYGQSIRFNLYRNGADLGYIGELRSRDADGTLNNMTSYCKTLITSLTAGDVITLYYVKTVGTDATISFFNINLLVHRIN